MKKLQLICAICASLSGFMFGVLSTFYGITRHDAMLIPFALIGFIGSAVMWANSRYEEYIMHELDRCNDYGSKEC